MVITSYAADQPIGSMLNIAIGGRDSGVALFPMADSIGGRVCDQGGCETQAAFFRVDFTDGEPPVSYHVCAVHAWVELG